MERQLCSSSQSRWYKISVRSWPSSDSSLYRLWISLTMGAMPAAPNICQEPVLNENGDPKAAALKLGRNVAIEVQANGTTTLRSDRRIMNPMPPKPTRNIAQVAGSGTADERSIVAMEAPASGAKIVYCSVTE